MRSLFSSWEIILPPIWEGRVDILWMLEDKVALIWWYYFNAASVFTEIKRKIEDSEEPYSYSGNAEDMLEEPPFLEEWQKAHESLNILGQSCLSLVQSTLKGYLSAFIRRTGTNAFPRVRRSEGWFHAYREFFLNEFGLDWSGAPVDLQLLEQVNFARNDSQHRGSEFNLTKWQNAEHHRRFPDGLFVADLFKATNEPGKINVSEDSLRKAMDAVHIFAAFIEGGCEPNTVAKSPGSDYAARWPPEPVRKDVDPPGDSTESSSD
jgi:hypothetical protein